jgi:hypothetical protein
MATVRQTMRIGAFLLPLLLLSACRHPAPAPHFPHEDALYLWQRAWTDEVRDALLEAPRHAGHIMVLAAEAGAPPIPVDWAALAAAQRPVTLVFRYPRLAATLDQKQQVLEDLLRADFAARQGGLTPDGVQLDFDSPTRGLPEYTALLKALRPALPAGLSLSVTALPTWLDSPHFAALVASLDYYVLQVHSFERPAHIDAPLVLCDTARIPDYTQRASAAGVPYYIAFPTHGYQVAYTPKGAFAGLIAEESESLHYPPGFDTREVRADPAAIAQAVARLRATPPAWYRGNVWFRMPVASDTRNWSWPVLAAVMEGRPPTASWSAEVRHPEPGLAEIWLASTGEDTAPLPVAVSMSIPPGEILAYDCVNGFSASPGESGNETTLRGPAPVGRDPTLIAWYRMRDAAAAEAIHTAPVVFSK